MRIPPLIAPVSATSLLRSLPESAAKSPLDAAIALREFLSQGRATVILSGAGISVDSNIPDYRGTLRVHVNGDLDKGPLELTLSITNIGLYFSMNLSLETEHVEDIGIQLLNVRLT